MLAQSFEDDNLRSRFVIGRSLLGATACIPQDSLDPQFGLPPTDGWPNGASQPDLGRHAESLCCQDITLARYKLARVSAIPSDMGNTFPLQ
jgi:hypothetical protein